MGRRILLGVLAYGLWLVSGALALAVFIQLRQFLLIDFPIMVLMPMGLSQYWLTTIDRFGAVTLGLIWLVFVVASEGYYRRLIEGRIGAKQVAKVFAAEIIVLAGAFAGSLLVA